MNAPGINMWNPEREPNPGPVRSHPSDDLLGLFRMMKMTGIDRKLSPLPFGRITGMEGLFQLGGRNGLPQRDIQVLVEQPSVGFLDVDGLPIFRHSHTIRQIVI